MNRIYDKITLLKQNKDKNKFEETCFFVVS